MNKINGFAIIVDSFNKLDHVDVVKWVQPLFPERLGFIPIFECASLTDYALIVNQYEPGSILLCNSELAEKIYGPPKDLFYSIRIESWAGKDVSVLICPSANLIEWDKLEPALDRLEEIL